MIVMKKYMKMKLKMKIEMMKLPLNKTIEIPGSSY